MFVSREVRRSSQLTRVYGISDPVLGTFMRAEIFNDASWQRFDIICVRNLNKHGMCLNPKRSKRNAKFFVCPLEHC